MSDSIAERHNGHENRGLDDTLMPPDDHTFPPDDNAIGETNLQRLANLRALSIEELPAASNTLRNDLINCVAVSGGHFAAGLGVVELTIALHYVYDTPNDQLIWDIGHQTYPHKILTGRHNQMSSIRKRGGLSGFPVRDESEFDAFGVAHAGTSISAALGLAIGAPDSHVVCVIGDGALTEGMAFEALNHASVSNANLTVVLNDNGMSISPKVGALCQQSQSNTFNHRLQSLFSALGCDYHGPFDGHDTITLSRELSRLKALSGIKVLHIETQKGKGYKPAELDPIKYHAVGPFDRLTDERPLKLHSTGKLIHANKKQALTYTDVFSQWVCDAAASNPDLHAITPAMREGSGLIAFEQQFADRYYDVGIAEQHAVTFAAGLACAGKKPVVAVYSSFLQRAYDQLIHDVALQNLDVLFAIDRSGLVGADGATHHGSFDLSYLRCIPNMVLMAPANEKECRQMLQTGLQFDGPAAVRYERGAGPGELPLKTLNTLPIGKGNVIREGSAIALLSFGGMLSEALLAGESLDATVIDMRFIKPLDLALLQETIATHNYLVTVENNAIAGGAGSAVNEAINQMQLSTNIINLGLPDQFVSHGTQPELLHSIQLDSTGILEQINAAWPELPL